ncbi:isocitrate/isopropylmalate dehydrogenase family protein [Streptomyces bathyalis]|uniref:Isocitrate/isopropylmalate dehydrogenase family protein n=1 Tax=Streptomyces bathyalis TaxID=2710756 RepID=A0A7T1WSG1_9ACTN|nr:isocitrate/isopropylmalate family dehydrogenase [Streptomyces bathyalis]QPP07496.1 isocitrate/isopropylmalate dehydrogenase family protein [Streptomyces bathyalis]
MPGEREREQDRERARDRGQARNAEPEPLDLVVIPGDGIGPELVDSALRVLGRVAAVDGFEYRVTTVEAGAGAYRSTGRALPENALDRLRAADGVLKGPVGLPGVRHPDGTEAGLLGGLLRIGLDTFANVRPMRLLPGVPGGTRHEAGEIDYVVVRENTEGLYLSRGAGAATPHAACDQLMVTRAGTERVVRYAFELARARSGAPADGTRRVTCVDKSNVLRSYALFRRVFDEVAEEYPDVATEHLYADAAAHDLVARPQCFDVMVMENFLGDVLSDLGAATVGGLGMCGSLNVGADAAYAEPVHGSAPDIAGQGLANPLSQILSLALLLDHAELPASGDRVRRAVESALLLGAVELGERGRPSGGTQSVTAAVCENLRP